MHGQQGLGCTGRLEVPSGGAFAISKASLLLPRCLTALAYIHSLDLIHCDLKPENVLIKSLSRCIVKVRLLPVSPPALRAPHRPHMRTTPSFPFLTTLAQVIDFGSSCFMRDPHSSYVQSRSYRAPEVRHRVCRLEPASRVWAACP